MHTRAKLLTFLGALVGAFVGTLIVAGIGTAIGVMAGILVGWRFAQKGNQAKAPPAETPPAM